MAKKSSFYDYDKRHPAAQSIQRILAGVIDKPEPTTKRINGPDGVPSIVPELTTHALMALQIAIENKLSNKLIEDFFRAAMAAVMAETAKEVSAYMTQQPAADILEHASSLEYFADEETRKYYELLCTLERLDVEAAYKK